jgi:predicted DNA-binding transcriptional regulator YafY
MAGESSLRRADRLFDIIQILRAATAPRTAAALAAELEVTTRTVYRDIATLQARRIPIEGAPGVGYVLRRGFDLPPLMFTTEEIDAITVGARLLSRTGDAGLQRAAASVLSKVTVILPETLRDHLAAAPFYVSTHGASISPVVDLAEIRGAIRDQRKMRITYSDEKGDRTHRVIWPFAVAYYVEATLICAWCELRNDYRHFRVDRIVAVKPMDQRYSDHAGRLMAQWLAMRTPARAPTLPSPASGGG